MPRDRDPDGRPRNNRPRDGLGRPLPRGQAGVERIPDDVQLPPQQSLLEAQRLLNEDKPFHAHEILEGTWKISDADERELWQGLAQLAVGLTHLKRGNLSGAVSLLTQGRTRIWPYHLDPPHGIDVSGLVRWAEEIIDDLDAGLVPNPATPTLSS